MIRIIKLTSGEEVIGFITPDSFVNLENGQPNPLLCVEHPKKIVQEYDKATQKHFILLVDWIPSAANYTYPIPKDKIITLATPQQSIEAYYLDLFEEEVVSDPPTQNTQQIEKLKNHKFSDDDMQ